MFFIKEEDTPEQIYKKSTVGTISIIFISLLFDLGFFIAAVMAWGESSSSNSLFNLVSSTTFGTVVFALFYFCKKNWGFHKTFILKYFIKYIFIFSTVFIGAYLLIIFLSKIISN